MTDTRCTCDQNEDAEKVRCPVHAGRSGRPDHDRMRPRPPRDRMARRPKEDR